MNPDQLLKHFEDISEADDAAPRLRELVLHLAVTGKLVKHESNKTSPEEIAQALKTGIEKLSKSSNRCRWNPTDPVSEEERITQFPPGWVYARINDTALYVNGIAFKPSDWKSSGLPIIRIQNLSDPAKEFNYTKGKFDEENLVRKGDLLVSWSATLDAYIWDREDAVLNQHIFKVLVNEKALDRAYLFWLLKHTIRELAESDHAHGLAMKHINRGPFLAHVVGIPPLTEQRRIVAKVNELMALCDELEAARTRRETRRDYLVAATLHRLNNSDIGSEASNGTDFKETAQFYFSHLPRLATRPEHIKQLRKAILSLAFRGKLVAQDPNDESVEDALRRFGLKSTFESIERSDDANPLPPSWIQLRFEDVAIVSGGVTLGRKFGGRKVAILPYLRVANVKRGELDLGTIKEISIPLDEVDRYMLRENDLLMTEGGDWDKVGRAAIWKAQIPKCLHQNHVFRSRMRNSEIIPAWFERYFNSPIGRQYFEKASKQTTNLASINMRQVRGCPVPFPPIAEQRRILAKMDKIMALCDELEAQLTTTATTRRQLLEATLHEAITDKQLSQNSESMERPNRISRTELRG